MAAAGEGLAAIEVDRAVAAGEAEVRRVVQGEAANRRPRKI